MVTEAVIHLVVGEEEKIDGEDEEAGCEEATGQGKEDLCKKDGEAAGSQKVGEEAGSSQGESCP